MALWLRSAGYSIELVNILPTFIDLLRALSSWLGTTLAGCLSLRGLWTFQASFVFFAIIVLAVWDVPEILKFVAFYFGGFSGMASPILYSWVNHTLADNYGERGLTISSMMTFGFCTQIWVPLFTFPTVQAPRFPNGYPVSSSHQEHSPAQSLTLSNTSTNSLSFHRPPWHSNSPCGRF
jgi:ACS family pantothenate transporter-like MFS transporter